ncbi:hypothetical protein ACJJTC_016702 [Scirpophaga incertulas]
MRPRTCLTRLQHIRIILTIKVFHLNNPHKLNYICPRRTWVSYFKVMEMLGYINQLGLHSPISCPPLDTAQKPLDVKQLKPEIKLEPADAQKRSHPENELLGGDLDQPKIKIKTDIFKPDDLARPQIDKPIDIAQKSMETHKQPDLQTEVK